PGSDRALRIGPGHAIEAFGIHQRAFADIRLAQGRRVIVARTRNHTSDRQLELHCKLEVTLVVTGHGHDGAGAVLSEHVIRDPNGNVVTGRRVAAVRTREHAGLVLFRFLTRDDVHRRGDLAVGVDRAALL